MRSVDGRVVFAAAEQPLTHACFSGHFLLVSSPFFFKETLCNHFLDACPDGRRKKLPSDSNRLSFVQRPRHFHAREGGETMEKKR